MKVEPPIQQVVRLFGYDHWANRSSAQSIEECPEAPPRAAACLDHIIAASWLWLDRISGHPQRLPVWPTFDREERLRQFSQLEVAWSAYLARLDETEWQRVIDYTNSKGEAWSNRVSDVLWHVPLHSAQHRGQIALLLRQAGGEPAYTDFIQVVRTGKITSG
jgi:uncharacterized damage-inducible protein DinB